MAALNQAQVADKKDGDCVHSQTSGLWDRNQEIDEYGSPSRWFSYFQLFSCMILILYRGRLGTHGAIYQVEGLFFQALVLLVKDLSPHLSEFLHQIRPCAEE